MNNLQNQISLFDLEAPKPKPKEHVCPVCHHPPQIRKVESWPGPYCYEVYCKCGRYPKTRHGCHMVYGSREEAVNSWMDVEARERDWWPWKEKLG